LPTRRGGAVNSARRILGSSRPDIRIASLLELAERYLHEAAQEHFNLVLAHERDFWTMSWKREIRSQ
jgi:hypothetical protein